MRGMRSKAVETKEDLESANTMRLMVSLAIKCPGGFTGYSDDNDFFHVDGFMFFANLQIKKQEHGFSHDFFAGQQKI